MEWLCGNMRVSREAVFGAGFLKRYYRMRGHVMEFGY